MPALLILQDYNHFFYSITIICFLCHPIDIAVKLCNTKVEIAV